MDCSRTKIAGGISCAAVNCTNRCGKLICKGKSFHKFPLTNKILLKQWTHMVGRKNWQPSKYSVLCSDHFNEDCFRKPVIMGQFVPTMKLLKKDTVPTIFSHRQPKVKYRKRPMKRDVCLTVTQYPVVAESHVQTIHESTVTSYKDNAVEITDEIVHLDHGYAKEDETRKISVEVQTDLTMKDMLELEIIEKVDLRSTTMIPHPEKIPESMMYQVVNIQKMASTKPKPKSSQQNIKGATLAHYINGLNCLECDRSMGRFHFSTHMWCSKCPYSTFCMKSYSEHMINMHSLKACMMQCKNQIHRTMYCLCQFATDDMILMAQHLVSCGKKTCYPTNNHVGMGVLAQSATFAPLVVLDDKDEATNFSKKLVHGLKHSSGKNQSSSLATGLSLATQLAASNRTDKTPEIDRNNYASSDDSSEMLNVLGLVRKTGTVVKSDGVSTDANNCNENKLIELENSEKTVAEESIARDDDAEKESRDDIIASDSNDPTTVENDDCESDDQNVEVPEWDMSIQIVNVQSLANTENVEMI